MIGSMSVCKLKTYHTLTKPTHNLIFGCHFRFSYESEVYFAEKIVELFSTESKVRYLLVGILDNNFLFKQVS